MLSLAPATRFIVPIEWGRNTGSTCRHSGGVLRRGCPQDLAGRRQRQPQHALEQRYAGRLLEQPHMRVDRGRRGADDRCHGLTETGFARRKCPPSTRLLRGLHDGNPAHHRRGDPATGDHQVEIHPAFEICAVFEAAALMAPDPHAAADELLDVHINAVDSKSRRDDREPQTDVLFHVTRMPVESQCRSYGNGNLPGNPSHPAPGCPSLTRRPA